jgi:hypothetical protein
VRRLVDALPAGNCLILSHATGDVTPEETRRTTVVHQQRGIALQARSRAEVAALAPAGMRLVEPGITMVHRWRPESDGALLPDERVSMYGLVARA